MVTKRIYVGHVLNNHDECFEELHKRFQRFGKTLDATFEKFESFGYINMLFDNESQCDKLKASFNRVKFKGNQLSVAEAKMDWKQRWELENADHEREKIKRKQILKQQWEHYKKLENINKSWIDRKEVILGRHRTKERSKYKISHLTFRVNVKGQLKIYKCHKTKLWGYERNKHVRDLVHKFVENYWKSGTEHIVDKLDYSRSRVAHFRNNSGDELTVKFQDSEKETENENIEDEREKNNALLSSILGTFDFDKPVLIEDAQDEEYGGEEYEYEAVYQSDDESKSKLSDKIEKPFKTEKKNSIITENSTKKTIEPDTYASDEEFIPSFGSAAGSNTESSTTNKLRDLLNPSTEATFKFIEESDDDIDHEKDIPEDLKTSITDISKSNTQQKHMLFFPHFDSPFLVGQTRLAKITLPSNFEDKFSSWEETFWANRSSWTKEIKQRKRDALRQKRKRGNLRGNLSLL